MIFLDSNILIYIFSDSEPDKQRRAREAIAADACVTGTNNLNEMNHVLSRKKILPVPKLTEVMDTIHELAQVKTVEISAMYEAVHLMNRYQYSYFDALVIAMALQHGCDTLYSEDMQHGQVIDNKLTIRNIFLTT